jgi:hypothetical protein
MTETKLASDRWLRHLHRLGYVTTAIVAAQLLFIAYMVGSEWWRQHQIDAAQRENTRTHIGALAEQPPDRVSPWVTGLLATLPPDDSSAPESLRIAILPSLSTRSYAISMTPAADGHVGIDFVMATENPCDVRTPLRIDRQNFTLPESDYRSFANWFDATTDAYAGSEERWLDGTVLAFERRKATRTTSGAGNIPSHYGKLAARLLTLLRPHLHGLPEDANWHVATPDESCPP